MISGLSQCYSFRLSEGTATNATLPSVKQSKALGNGVTEAAGLSRPFRKRANASRDRLYSDHRDRAILRESAVNAEFASLRGRLRPKSHLKCGVGENA